VVPAGTAIDDVPTAVVAVAMSALITLGFVVLAPALVDANVHLLLFKESIEEVAVIFPAVEEPLPSFTST
jgi:hypothetical protein